MKKINMQGWLRDYQIENPEAYVNEVLNLLCGSNADVRGEIRPGASVSQVAAHLRDKGFQLPGLRTDQEKMMECLGFTVEKGKVGKWTRGGYKYCQPSVVVTI
jgi:sigma54-dependent transcription regulator